MITQDTLSKVQKFCTPAIDTGLIPEKEFKELLESGTSSQSPPPLDPNLLTKKRVAAMLTISIRQLDRIHEEGQIKYVKVGKRAIRIPEESFKEYVKNNVI